VHISTLLHKMRRNEKRNPPIRIGGF
jgi:hypothetical protein